MSSAGLGNTSLRTRTLLSVLLVMGVLNFGFISLRAWRTIRTPYGTTQSTYSYRYPEYLPLTVDTVLYTPEETTHYRPLGEQSLSQWYTTTSAGGGYVWLGPEDRVYMVSMFHELHCLATLNRAFSKMTGATPEHLKHCLAYLRQNILCSPDLTLEEGEFEKKDFAVERTGGTHTCKDWDAIYRFMDDNFYEWKNRTGYKGSEAF